MHIVFVRILLRMRFCPFAYIALADPFAHRHAHRRIATFFSGIRILESAIPFLQCPQVRNLFPAPLWMHSRIGNPSSNHSERLFFLRTFGCFACPFGGLGIVCCRLMIFPGVSLLDWNLSAVLPFMRHHRLFGGIRGGYYRRISFEKFEW